MEKAMNSSKSRANARSSRLVLKVQAHSQTPSRFSQVQFWERLANAATNPTYALTALESAYEIENEFGDDPSIASRARDVRAIARQTLRAAEIAKMMGKKVR